VIRRLPMTIVLAAAAVTGAAGQPGRPQPAGRTVVVISDLHLGEGRTSSGAWRPREDFRWSSEFAQFLQAVDADGRSAVDLILNGDTLDLLESTAGPCTAASVGCTEAEMLGRAARVLAAHDADLRALGRFAAAGANRVVLVPGDRDAALLFAGVRSRAITTFAAPGRVEVAAGGRWVTPDGRIAAEHGHQLGLSVQKFENWPKPFVRYQGRELLATRPGEAALQALFTRLEERYPIVDNLAASGVGVKYALAGDLEAGTLAPLMRTLLLSTPWQQFRMELDDGEVEPPVWDLEQVRKQGAAFFVASFPDDDPFKPRVVGAATSGALGTLEDWSNDELAGVCDYRAAVRRARRRFEPLVTQFAPRGPAVAECPRTPATRGAQFDYFWRSRDETFAQRLKMIAAETGGRAPDVFVHGHTHLADRSQYNANMISGGLLKIPMEGFSPVRGALLPIAINSGAWQRTITPAQYERLRSARSMSDDQLLGSLQPEDLPACYSFVRIPPYTDVPAPAVRYWRQAGGEWRMAESCGGQ
jgi:UDP-2,3-diacylglucosamine pyrophosphatase LpxH